MISTLPAGTRVTERMIDRLAMAHDASHYLLVPDAVLTPATRDEVVEIFVANRLDPRPLTFRSGGTSLSGQGVSDSLLIDTRESFRGIDVLDDGMRVRVQPGATVRQVNARLARYRRRLGPDPASEAACTIGGVIANNSSGMACGILQNTYRTLESMVVVLTSGTVVDTAHPEADERLRRDEPALHEGLGRLRDRVRGNPASVATIEQQFSMKNTMGYGVNAFLDFDRPVDILSHLVIGSEGTLGFVAEAVFRTVEIKAHAATGLMIFDSLAAATASLPSLVESGYSTIELMDAASLAVAQLQSDAPPSLRSLPVSSHAAFLVELQADSAEEVAQLAADRAMQHYDLSVPLELSTDAATRASLWHIRKGLYTAVAGARPSGTTALLEDIAVPVGALLDTCESLTRLFDEHDYENSVIFGHAKDGNIHFMLNERFEDPASLKRYERFTEEMVDLVLDHEGVLKAEHGTGRIMAPFVRRQYGDELYEVMRELKQLIEPTGWLNPGVILTDDADSYTKNLKVVPTVEVEVDRCVECGYCEPVCPSKSLTMTPRQRIVIRREIEAARQRGDTALVRELERDYVYEGEETCAVDGMCQTACPVLINTGDLVRRLRAESRGALEGALWKGVAQGWGATATVGGIALTVADRLPAALPAAATTVGRAILGTDTVPAYTADLPAGGSRRRPLAADTPQAVYFPSCTSTMFGPAIDGEPGVRGAFLELCDRAGVSVTIPEGIAAACCGTPWKSKGYIEGYHVMSDRTLSLLWEATRHGELPIVCDAASCTEGLETMRDLALAVESNPYGPMRVVDAVDFVHENVIDQLRVSTPLESIVVHPTCSSAALGTTSRLVALAQAISDDVDVPVAWGCCGFAGDRGMLHPELTASATAAEAAEVATRDYAAYASTNRTCELGMTRATGHDYEHILEIVERATR
ncbi:MAG: FAD-binding oxidoreductase [Microbacteriaceae bacterium]|nr:FAD-binding oxidoreductase [Microbacteriaceae bacterium]